MEFNRKTGNNKYKNKEKIKRSQSRSFVLQLEQNNPSKAGLNVLFYFERTNFFLKLFLFSFTAVTK